MLVDLQQEGSVSSDQNTVEVKAFQPFSWLTHLCHVTMTQSKMAAHARLHSGVWRCEQAASRLLLEEEG